MSDKTPTDGSITRELREWADSAELRVSAYNAVHRIADRIDEAHANATQRAYWSSLEGAAEYFTDEDLAAHGLVRLPVGADGEVIRPGDVLESTEMESDTALTAKTLVLGDGGWGVSAEMVESCHPHYFRHHKPTPAERIRKILDNLDYDNTVKEQPEPLLTIQERDELYSIANELEGARQ